jgi:hypothetical protein
MPYGLDLEAVQYLTDDQGKQHAMQIPVPMFTTLTEFWIAARRARTARTEAQARPGQYKGSLQAHVPSGEGESIPTIPEQTAAPPAPFSSDGRWQQLLHHMPNLLDQRLCRYKPPRSRGSLNLGGVVQPRPNSLETARRSGELSRTLLHPVETSAVESASPEPKPKPAAVRFFFREFIAPIPDEVSALIRDGVYFLRPWRMYRELSTREAAELTGKTQQTSVWHERGCNRPSLPILQVFADAYDCTIEQLTVKPGSDRGPFSRIESTHEKSPPAAGRAPANTDYPDAVPHSLIEGKSPMLAWRLYHRLTLTQLSEQYGTKAANLKKWSRARCARKRSQNSRASFTANPNSYLCLKALRFTSAANPPRGPL